jgi:hypothetical protein
MNVSRNYQENLSLGCWWVGIKMGLCDLLLVGLHAAHNSMALAKTFSKPECYPVA